MIGRGVAYRKTEETNLLCSERGPVDREGSSIPQNGGNGPPTVETGVLFIGRGVAYRKTEETDLCWSATVETGGPVHREGCGVPQNGTPRDTVHLHRRPPPASMSYCSSTVDLLQPPPMTVHPWAPVHPASTARYSTGYCSTNPPPSIVHLALHTMGSCSSRGNANAHCSSNPPATLTVHPRGSIDRLQLAAVAKESLDRVQLTAIDRSLGFSKA